MEDQESTKFPINVKVFAKLTLQELVAPQPLLPHSNILKLTLNKKWFDLIKSGKKTEEYREVKSHWIQRLCHNGDLRRFKQYDQIEFRNGYQKDAPKLLIECKGISIGKPSGPGNELFTEDVFIIKLGKISY